MGISNTYAWYNIQFCYLTYFCRSEVKGQHVTIRWHVSLLFDVEYSNIVLIGCQISTLYDQTDEKRMTCCLNQSWLSLGKSAAGYYVSSERIHERNPALSAKTLIFSLMCGYLTWFYRLIFIYKIYYTSNILILCKHVGLIFFMKVHQGHVGVKVKVKRSSLFKTLLCQKFGSNFDLSVTELWSFE
jgi:hypothetical protein